MVGKAWRQELETGSHVTRAVRKYRKEREALKSYGLPLVTHLPKGHKGSKHTNLWEKFPIATTAESNGDPWLHFKGWTIPFGVLCS